MSRQRLHLTAPYKHWIQFLIYYLLFVLLFSWKFWSLYRLHLTAMLFKTCRAGSSLTVAVNGQTPGNEKEKKSTRLSKRGNEQDHIKDVSDSI